MIDFSPFFQQLANTGLEKHSAALEKALNYRLEARFHGDLAGWQQALDALPELDNISYTLDDDCIQLHCEQPVDSDAITQALMQLHPWRKGPFDFFGVHIDTEWHSDWKWQRIAPHLRNLANKTVLDVGCGSGYHAWRMRGAGARLVVGIDPSPKFVMQFAAVKKYLPEEPVHVLPLMSEDLPAQMQCFDTVFSMGVLYHRKSPFEHLEELKGALVSGGELVLETLVVDGDINTILVPGERYAQMRNVWFIPSTQALEHWLERLGFHSIRTVDINTTSIEEQRQTDWMTFNSLRDFLDPSDHSKTIEGYPAPKRAVIIATKA
jgi:tRNA (mo5U34)-methyltransferase